MSNTAASVLSPPKDLNQRTLEEFRATVEPHVELGESGAEGAIQPGGAGIVFDLSTMEFVNSTGLGYIVAVGKRLSEQNRRLALARANKQVEKLIRMVGLNQVLPLFKTLPEATRHVERR